LQSSRFGTFLETGLPSALVALPCTSVPVFRGAPSAADRRQAFATGSSCARRCSSTAGAPALLLPPSPRAQQPQLLGAGSPAAGIAAALALAAAVAASAAAGGLSLEQWERRRTSGVRCEQVDLSDEEEYVKSQEHLLQPNLHNPNPVVVPPPIQTLSGHQIRHRVVLAVIGLPLRGQAHIAKRLRHYLDFFHGAHTSLFNLNDFVDAENPDEALLESLRSHFEAEGTNCKRHAILYTTNSLNAAPLQWSGHSKSRRRWMNNVLEKELGAELHLIELQVNDDLAHNFMYMAQHIFAQKFDTPEALQSHINLYKQRFVTIQEDGTEDYLAYIKVINYNSKVVTCNMMQTFLGSRVARFLCNVHPYRHTVYFSRCGTSEFSVEHRIGGNSSLSEPGKQYSLRLAEFAHFVVDKQHDDFACVSLEATDTAHLRKLLINAPFSEVTRGGEVLSFGDWSPISSSDAVKTGMRLRRLQRGQDRPFEDAPHNVEEVIKAVGSGPVTLVFTDQSDDDEKPPVYARLWTSALKRAKETVEHFKHPIIRVEGEKVWRQLAPREYRNLNEQYAGEYEGLTLDEIRTRQPAEVELRTFDKLGYRYPRGESLLDVIARLEDMVQHLESYQEPVMVVAHLPVLRFLYAYIKNIPRDQAPDLDLPYHSVIKVTFDGARGVQETRYSLGPWIS